MKPRVIEKGGTHSTHGTHAVSGLHDQAEVLPDSKPS